MKCPVCEGAGVESKKPRKPILGKHVITESQEDRDVFQNETDYLIARWQLTDAGSRPRGGLMEIRFLDHDGIERTAYGAVNPEPLTAPPPSG